MIDKKGIGRRILEARLARGITSQDALKVAMQGAARRLLDQDDALATLTRQTVQNWEAGKVVPPWDKVELLALVFGAPYGEEWLMFGSRREDELNAERPVLSRLTPDEAELIQHYRHTNDAGKRSTIGHAKAMRQEFPATGAGVHALPQPHSKKK